LISDTVFRFMPAMAPRPLLARSRARRVHAAALLLAVLGQAVPARAATDCVIREFLTARGVDRLEPVEPASRFQSNRDRVHAFLRLDCSQVEPSRSQLQVRWILDGRVVRQTTLTVGVSPNWRAYDWWPALAGNGLVQVFDSQGELIAEEPFTVTLR